MAKALMGHLGQDPRIASEVARLRAKVRELEAEVENLRANAVITIDSPIAVAPVDSVTTGDLEFDRATPVLA